MRLIIQQVSSAKVMIEKDHITREIGPWILVFLGIHKDDLGDYPEKIKTILYKLTHLKYLSWKDHGITTSLEENHGEILLISNFTVYWRNHKGTKMDFMYAAPFQEAKHIYDYFIEQALLCGLPLKTWEFWADMQIQSTNEWPVNYVLDF